MTIKQFIEKAIEGGWDKGRAKVVDLDMRDGYEGLGNSMQSTDRMLLDPKSWEAVGKVSSWEVHECEGDGTGEGCGNGCYPTYRDKMHQMIDHLIAGGSIESYLKTL